MKHTFPTSEPLDVFVEIGSGSVSVLVADTDQAIIEVDGRDADQVDVGLENGRLSVVAPRRTGFLSGFTGLTISVTAPRGSSLGTRLGSAGVTVEGTLDHVRINTGSGEVTLEDVADNAVVKTGSGSVAIRSVGSDADIKTGSGDIGIGQLGGAARLTTGSGDIEVGRASGPISFKTGSGDILVREAQGKAQLAAGSGHLHVARIAQGEAELKNASGDIRVGVPAGTPVWTDISSVSGHVRSTLPPTGAPQDGQGHVEVRARTVSGDVFLESL